MIGQLVDRGHDPNPLTIGGLLRLLVVASTVVTLQVSLLDPSTTPILQHLDLPVVVAASLVLARPTHSTAIALVFGLVVDASGQRLFGLHCVAYASLGPVAHRLPVPAWHRWGALVAWRVGAQALTVATIVAVGRTIAAGTAPAGLAGQVLQTAAVAGLVAVPVGRWLRVVASPVHSRAAGGSSGRRSTARARSWAIRPLGS